MDLNKNHGMILKGFLQISCSKALNYFQRLTKADLAENFRNNQKTLKTEFGFLPVLSEPTENQVYLSVTKCV